MNGRRSSGPRAILALALAACGHPASQPAPPSPAGQAVPVYREPRHRPVYQNRLVRVLDVRIPAGDTTGYHVHAAPMVVVDIEDARTWAQSWGAPPGSEKAPARVPSIFQNWSQALPYTHRVANADTVPIHYVVAEWLGPSVRAPSAAPDGQAGRLVEDGPTTRVYEIVLGPGEATEAHTHAGPGLTVLATTGSLSEEGATPQARGGAGAGSWIWHEAGFRHVLRNDGDAPLTVYEIDWR